MYHVPTDDKWDAKAIAESLRKQEVDAELVDDTGRVTLPITKPRSMVGKLFHRLAPQQPLHITISFCPDNFLRNVDLAYDPMKMPLDFPCFDAIAEAMHERGYLTDDDRTITARYCPDSPELAELLDRLERLEIQKEDACAKQDFESAVVARDQEVIFRAKIDAKLFELVGQRPSNDDPSHSPKDAS